MEIVDGGRYTTETDTEILGFFNQYRFLSNFHSLANPIVIDGLAFRSSEAAYMSFKFSKLSDKKLIAEATPAEAKKLGRKAVLPEDWEDTKYEIMLTVVREKFKNNGDIREKLLATGDKYLEETNNWNDTYWGVCAGQGQNMLGRILMQVREELKT